MTAIERPLASATGGRAVGTQGTPVELLGRLIHNRMYPELWEVRDELTRIAKERSE